MASCVTVVGQKKTVLKFPTGNGSFEAHRLAAKGVSVAERVAASVDLRIDEVDRLPYEEKRALSVEAHYRMLERAGFDLRTVDKTLALQ